MRARTSRSVWVLAIAPAAVAAVVAAGLALLGPDVRFVVSGQPAGAVLGVGVLVTAIAVAALLSVRAGRRAVAAARFTTIEESRADHRRFLARLDHELKNPVTAIRASLAAEGHFASPHLAAADAQASRLADLVAELRKLAELHTYPLQIEVIDLPELAAEAVDAVQQQLVSIKGGQRDITLSFPTAPWQLPPINADPDLLYLAVHNVLANAAKFTCDGDRIEVRGSEYEGWVELEVADTGIGIPEEDLDAVWDELARASNARGTPGSGLGLALVRVVVERHGGTVAVRSRPDQGTSVRLRLPILH